MDNDADVIRHVAAETVTKLIQMAIAFSGMRHSTATPTTTEIVDEIDVLADAAKEVLRRGGADSMRASFERDLSGAFEEAEAALNAQ